jgi:hypothetical protein
MRARQSADKTLFVATAGLLQSGGVWLRSGRSTLRAQQVPWPHAGAPDTERA